MAVYNELIKNFDKIREYLRDFYIYGFKSRREFDRKSARSYDDERRRLESWLGEYMSFVRTSEGKNVFISIDSRQTKHNPLYKAWKSKSFTDGDITLHFIIFDILYTPEIKLTLSEFTEKIYDEYIAFFDEPFVFDESTLRKKLNEYVQEGIIVTEKKGRHITYSRSQMEDITVNDGFTDALDFFSEVAPCGVVGSFLLDKYSGNDRFTFKHHYITGTMDSSIMEKLFEAMHGKNTVRFKNTSRHHNVEKYVRIVPLKIYISVQNGRQHLLGYHPETKQIRAFRLDYISEVEILEKWAEFDELRHTLTEIQKHMWGVNCISGGHGLEHVEFDIHIGDGEEYLVKRLEREKRTGQVEKIDSSIYRFSADVYDTSEMIPWIRTFICRIKRINFSNRTIENRFKQDIEEMYKMYDIYGEKKVIENDFQ